ncbi:two-component system, OmpR family, sensor histidine kinase VicK/two-component system, chemotaxis family, CheB/CheR fusion protein [Mucilaginibacter pineti]|uniref:Two-component system, OmpR family, sensor histidine kinase VicK/two-component system, chemotaxis family, CheB/CheR fusion protein n=2 Tax=Mucilaginibacter pineti TaxID=1391627 RepID=A0A1G7HA35_9SPHI|nr:two-component system, OmpR family, sensor histidine kinase VicK/two-component system, chemotaxis family, CheB/CheR fusion protein [Mucilaginibacter pineti]
MKRRTDMAAKLREIADEYQGMQPAMTIKVLCHAPEHPVYAALDGDKFSQVIQNLISNALKFTPDGGTITLDLKEEKNIL